MTEKNYPLIAPIVSTQLSPFWQSLEDVVQPSTSWADILGTGHPIFSSTAKFSFPDIVGSLPASVGYLFTTSFTEELATAEESSLLEILDSSASVASFDNRLNARRLTQFKSEFSSKLINWIKEQDFEYGFNSPADTIVKDCLEQNEVVTKQWLNELFITNFSNVEISVGLLRVISHIDYERIAPQGPTMALAALSNRNSEVQEGGIRAFENWGNIEALEALKSAKCSEEWLENYRSQVVEDLTAELA